MLSVGGSKFGTANMTLMLSSSANRSEFIQTSITYLRERNFDGLDLHFEYPASGESPTDDKYRYSLLIQVNV
jgi:chitinase